MTFSPPVTPPEPRERWRRLCRDFESSSRVRPLHMERTRIVHGTFGRLRPCFGPVIFAPIVIALAGPAIDATQHCGQPKADTHLISVDNRLGGENG